MSNGAYAGLRLAARASNPDPDNDPNSEPDGNDDGATPPKGKKKKDETQMNDEASAAAIAAAEQTGVSKGAKAANERFSAVLASEHYAGREKLAHKLLDNFSLSAEDVIGALAEAPKGGAQAEAADPEAAARQAMQNALAASANSDIAPDGGANAGGKGKQDASALWAQAQASLNPRGRQ